MAQGSFLKPSTSASGLGKKSTDKGQFSNPPEYPEVSGFDGSSKIGPKSGIMSLQKSPSAKKGKV